jgi:hypothetical protein
LRDVEDGKPLQKAICRASSPLALARSFSACVVKRSA